MKPIKLEIVLSTILVVATAITLIVILGEECRIKPSEFALVWVTFFLATVTGVVIYWQGYLIKQQVRFQTLLELEKEWNGKEMIFTRETVYEPQNNQFVIPKLEGILEFFEKFAFFVEINGIDASIIIKKATLLGMQFAIFTMPRKKLITCVDTEKTVFFMKIWKNCMTII